MKKILIPTDFSKHAEYALNVAAQIARRNNGEIILLHMLELPNSGNDTINRSYDIPELMIFKNAALNRLNEIAHSPILDGIEVSQVIQFELAFDGILNVSRVNNVDLIVMGSHGASGFKEMFIGSNAEKVVRSSEVPVLIVKKDIENLEINNIVFASDFADKIKKPFSKAIVVANQLGAKLHLVTINTPNNFKTTQEANLLMKDFVESFDIDNYELHIYNDLNIEKGILNFARTINADLIAMSTHGRKGLSHFLNGSISEDLVNHANRPVMTFKI